MTCADTNPAPAACTEQPPIYTGAKTSAPDQQSSPALHASCVGHQNSTVACPPAATTAAHPGSYRACANGADYL
eukprot:1941429-Pleurochrysis_carterae.AAC.1